MFLNIKWKITVCLNLNGTQYITVEIIYSPTTVDNAICQFAAVTAYFNIMIIKEWGNTIMEKIFKKKLQLKKKFTLILYLLSIDRKNQKVSIILQAVLGLEKYLT